MRISNCQSFASGVAAVLLLASVAVRADVVVNGGFETGNFTGWTQFGDTSFTGVVDSSATIPPNPSPVESGTWGASFGPLTPGGIFQTLPTLPGRFYTVTFGLQDEVDVFGQSTPNSFTFNWNGGAAEFALSNSAAFPYHNFSFSLQATSAATDLRFTFANTPAFWDLDNVSASIPEPGSMALAGLAATLVAAFHRRRRHT